MSNIKENKLFDSIVNNCIVNMCKYVIDLHNINPCFNSHCLDMIVRFNITYLIDLINVSLPKLNDPLLSTFKEHIEKYKPAISIDNINYVKGLIDVIIETVIITLKTHHDDSNNIITQYVKYGTCEDILYIGEEMLNRID